MFILITVEFVIMIVALFVSNNRDISDDKFTINNIAF